MKHYQKFSILFSLLCCYIPELWSAEKSTFNLDVNKSFLLKKRNVKLKTESVTIDADDPCPWPELADKVCEAENYKFHPVRQKANKVVQKDDFKTIASGCFGRVSGGTIVIDGKEQPGARKDFFSKVGFREKSVKEYDVLSQISGHVCVPKVYSLVIGPTLCFMIMDKGGVSLKQLYSEFSGPENEKNFLLLSLKLTEALNWIHEKKVFHGDLKDENILIRFLESGFDLKIVDFGESGGSLIPFDGSIRGSSFHISPEQFKPDHIPGPHMDTFSTGVLLYKLRYNQIPQKHMSKTFTNDYEYYTQNYFESDWDLNASKIIKDDIDDIVLSHMIHPNPESRLSMKELNLLFQEAFKKRFAEDTSATN